MTGTPPIRLVGLKDAVAMEEHSAHTLVDIANISATGGNSADVFLDEGIDVKKQNDREWIAEILKITLSECGEAQAQIEFA